MKVLHLTLKKKWFDMIASGEKKEEYREYKWFWKARLCVQPAIGPYDTFKSFDVVKFTHGYAKNAPSITVECKGIDIGYGHEKWGGGYKEVFVIKLGNIIKAE